MSKLSGKRRVSPIRGELLRYHVESWTEKDEDHLVDLLANDGAGECDCIRWSCNIWPMIRDRKKDWRDPVLECSHIRAAKRYLIISIIREGLDHEQQHL